MRAAAKAAGWDEVKPLKTTVTVNPGVTLYSTSTGTPAVGTGISFPALSALSLINNGNIYGAGGDGGVLGGT